MNTLIEFNNVSHYFEQSNENDVVQVLNSINFSIHREEIVSLLGPSGSGKSTILNLISDIYKPTSGVVNRLGISSLNIGVVFQKPALLRWRSVYDNIVLPLELNSQINGYYNESHIHSLISDMELSGTDKYYPYQLSIGMQHRVSLARALILAPKLLLLDEPFSALDFITKHNIKQLLLKEYEEHKFSIFLITHDIYEAIELSDRILVLSDKPSTIILNESIDQYNKTYLVDKIKKIMTSNN